MSYTLDNSAADRLISAHDGDVALLYIWLCRNGSYDADRAARDLCMTSRQLSEAREKLSRLEPMDYAPAPVPEREPPPPEPEERIPEYTAKDIVERSSADSGFKAILDEAQRTLGRALSTADMKTLFGIYDYLALPPQVIFLLLHYCVSICAEKYGSGRLPSMRAIEKEAYVWANREILTVEQAEEYIERSMKRRGDMGRVQEALGIRGRALTSTESKYIQSWLDMGFDAEALAVAYDRTVTNTGALKWGYMNKIVLSWHEKGLHTADEIKEKDRRPPSSRHPKGSSPEISSVSREDYESTLALLDKIKNQ